MALWPGLVGKAAERSSMEPRAPDVATEASSQAESSSAEVSTEDIVAKVAGEHGSPVVRGGKLAEATIWDAVAAGACSVASCLAWASLGEGRGASDGARASLILSAMLRQPGEVAGDASSACSAAAKSLAYTASSWRIFALSASEGSWTVAGVALSSVRSISMVASPVVVSFGTGVGRTVATGAGVAVETMATIASIGAGKAGVASAADVVPLGVVVAVTAMGIAGVAEVAGGAVGVARVAGSVASSPPMGAWAFFWGRGRFGMIVVGLVCLKVCKLLD